LGEGIADDYTGQAVAVTERSVADVCNGVGNGDAGQTVAFTVFASRFVSVICMLKGRKMPRRNL